MIIVYLILICFHFFMCSVFFNYATNALKYYRENKIVNKITISRFYLISFIIPFLSIIGILIITIYMLIEEIKKFPFIQKYLEFMKWVFDTWNGDIDETD